MVERNLFTGFLYVTHIQTEFAAQHKLISCVWSSCPVATTVSRYLPSWHPAGVRLVWTCDHFFQVISSNLLFVQMVIPTWCECRVRPLLLCLLLLPFDFFQASPISSSGMCLCLMAPGLAKSSHWLTGGFASLAFAEAVNHQLSIATVSHSFGHPFVCISSAL